MAYASSFVWPLVSASSWISVKSVTTRAAVRNDIITLDIAENKEASARTATIELLYDDTTVGSIEIYQQSQIIANNEIAYTTTDNKVANPTLLDALGSKIVSNTYNNGRGLIVCESDITTIGTAFRGCSKLQTRSSYVQLDAPIRTLRSRGRVPRN